MTQRIIERRQATTGEKVTSQKWQLWESGELAEFNYDYDRDVEFIVQKGEAVIRSSNAEDVSISAGCRVFIPAGISACWEIRIPIVNRYAYR